MNEENKCCATCAHSYFAECKAEHGGFSEKIRCRCEEEIPFFDMEEEILDPFLDNCALWEKGDDGKWQQ